MNEWLIPAKTFLIGEYVALNQGPAIIITTTPYFRIKLIDNIITNISQINPQSPTGRFWTDINTFEKYLFWEDPYNAIGGLGASSAQFLGAYLAYCFLHNLTPNSTSLLELYYTYSWHGKGLRPSGYDVLSQAQDQCVYINSKQGIIRSYPWIFKDLDFLIIHNGAKLITHKYLESINLPKEIFKLTPIATIALEAFEHQDGDQLIDAINAYQKQLELAQLVTQQSLKNLKILCKYKQILAAKGCGAMGADVLLVIVESAELNALYNELTIAGWRIIACSKNMNALKAGYFSCI